MGKQGSAHRYYRDDKLQAHYSGQKLTDGPTLVHRLADDVHDAAERLAANRHLSFAAHITLVFISASRQACKTGRRLSASAISSHEIETAASTCNQMRRRAHPDGDAGVGDGRAAGEAVGLLHGDGAHGVVTQVLRHFQHKPHIEAGHLQRRRDGRQLALEPHVDDGTNHLRRMQAQEFR